MLANSKLEWWVLGLAWAWQPDIQHLTKKKFANEYISGELVISQIFSSRFLLFTVLYLTILPNHNSILMKEKTTILYKMYLLSQPVWKIFIYTLDWSTLKVVQAGSGCFWKQKNLQI